MRRGRICLPSCHLHETKTLQTRSFSVKKMNRDSLSITYSQDAVYHLPPGWHGNDLGGTKVFQQALFFRGLQPVREASHQQSPRLRCRVNHTQLTFDLFFPATHVGPHVSWTELWSTSRSITSVWVCWSTEEAARA